MPNARDITVTIQRQELRELARKALAQGFKPGGVRKHGIWLLAPNGVDTVSIAHTTGDRRAADNALADLKRLGFKDDDKSSNGNLRPPPPNPLGLKAIDVLVQAGKPMTGQEISAMLGVPWDVRFSDMIRHLAARGVIELYGKLDAPGAPPGTKQNVYVHKGYTKPEPTAPQPAITHEQRDDGVLTKVPVANPKPANPPANPRVPFSQQINAALRALDHPVHTFELAEYMGAPERLNTINAHLSSESRAPFDPCGNIRPSGKVRRPGNPRPIQTYRWVVEMPPAAEPDVAKTVALAPPKEEPPTTDETAVVGQAIIDLVRDHDASERPQPVAAHTTLLGMPLYFWENLARGLAYGLSKTREREENA